MYVKFTRSEIETLRVIAVVTSYGLERYEKMPTGVWFSWLDKMFLSDEELAQVLDGRVIRVEQAF